MNASIENLLWPVSQRILAAGARTAIEDRVRRWIAAHPARGRHLDVGCGPRPRLREAGVERAVGVDIHPGWGITASAVRLPFAAGAFDRVWSFGLLHHLDQAEAAQALGEMFRVTRRGGFVIVFDGVLPEDGRLVASMIRRLDRGAHLRRQTRHVELLARRGAWECERMTYAWTGLEGIFAWSRKEADSGCR